MTEATDENNISGGMTTPDTHTRGQNIAGYSTVPGIATATSTISNDFSGGVGGHKSRKRKRSSPGIPAISRSVHNAKLRSQRNDRTVGEPDPFDCEGTISGSGLDVRTSGIEASTPTSSASGLITHERET